MIELIFAGVAGAFGHIMSKQFVHQRLRFTSWVRNPRALGLAAGVATAAAAAPVVMVAPFVGLGSAVFLGLAVGSGVGLGARNAKENKPLPSKTSG